MDLVVTSEIVRWRECEGVGSCADIERSRPAKELLAIEHVAEITLDGRRIEVVRLSLEPRPTYAVPYVRPTRR